MITGLAELQNDIRKVKNIDIYKLNERRAKSFNSMLAKSLKEDSLGLLHISPSTKRNRISDLGGPLYDTGEFANSPSIRKLNNDADAGYFEGEKTIRGKIDSARLADIHNEGRGNNPWRPFMDNAKEKFEKELDEGIIEAYLDEVLSVI